MAEASVLEQIEGLLGGLTEEQVAEVDAECDAALGHQPWYPNPGPQTEAYFCEADELYYGGQAGGGKTDLILGLAYNEHLSSLILRRLSDDTSDMVERFLGIRETREGYNDQKKRFKDGKRIIDFGGCKDEADKQRRKGRAKDLYCFDEIADFTESMYTFITIWNRSAVKGQRCRVICTGNPPTTPEGAWVIDYWGAWLNPKHPNPAKPGELRWYYRNEKGEQVESEGPGVYIVDGVEVEARSRTFIPATLNDNPDLADTNYGSLLNSLPGDLKEAYAKGNHAIALKSSPMQMIPTEWVQAAMDRWTERPVLGVPMCNLAIDVAEGGKDNNTIMWRHDAWFSKIIRVPGIETPTGGHDVSGLAVTHRKDKCIVTVDCGGGFGSRIVDKLKDNDIAYHAHKGAETTTECSNDSLAIGFVNTRTLAHWRVREALDPAQPGGSDMMIPPDTKLLRQLTAPYYALTSRGYAMEPKDKLKKRLGFSPDDSDVLAMCNLVGPRAITHASLWMDDAKLHQGRPNRRQKVNNGPSVTMKRR